MVIELGRKVKDKITGYTGVVTSHVKYLTGCDHFGVTPVVDKDGKCQAAEYFDGSRLEYVDEPAVKLASVKTGGPNRDCPK